MKVRFFPIHEAADRDRLQGAAVVVIDVLRATSTIIAAVENGAGSIIPVEDVETASRLVSAADRGGKLLAGERKGLPVEGFDLFNSPVEISRGKIAGKTIILTTTNGTKAICAASKADRIYICSLNNVIAAAEKIADEKSLAIVCSGNSGRIAAEDLLCGGILLDGLGAKVKEEHLDDAGRLALFLARRYSGNAGEFLSGCDRGMELSKLGYVEDLIYCSRIGSASIVPEVRQGTIAG